MTKRITADHVKLKCAYEPATADDGTRILATAYGHAGSGKPTPRSINGSRISRRARPCGNGSVTTLLAGPNFGAGARLRFTGIPNISADYGPWQDKDRSRSC